MRASEVTRWPKKFVLLGQGTNTTAVTGSNMECGPHHSHHFVAHAAMLPGGKPSPFFGKAAQAERLAAALEVPPLLLPEEILGHESDSWTPVTGPIFVEVIQGECVLTTPPRADNRDRTVKQIRFPLANLKWEFNRILVRWTIERKQE